MIGYYVPHRVHPAGYHCDPRQPLPFVMLASQKGYIAIHMMPIYTASAAPAGSAEAEICRLVPRRLGRFWKEARYGKSLYSDQVDRACAAGSGRRSDSKTSDEEMDRHLSADVRQRQKREIQQSGKAPYESGEKHCESGQTLVLKSGCERSQPHALMLHNL